MKNREKLEKGMKIRVQIESDLVPPFLLRSTENWRAGGYAAWCVCVFCQIGIDTPDKRWTALTTKPPVSIQIPCSRKRPDATCPPDPHRNFGLFSHHLPTLAFHACFHVAFSLAARREVSGVKLVAFCFAFCAVISFVY